MIVQVGYTVTYYSEHEVPDDEPVNVSSLPIEIPTNDTNSLDPDSFHVLGVYDEDGEEVDYEH